MLFRMSSYLPRSDIGDTDQHQNESSFCKLAHHRHTKSGCQSTGWQSRKGSEDEKTCQTAELPTLSRFSLQFTHDAVTRGLLRTRC
jgi:hypothetical protein